MKQTNNRPPIIIRRVEAPDHDAHHGGAWKVAYADFMTALMAFFLLMWILSTADEDKLKGLSDYFTPTVSVLGGPGGEGVMAGTELAERGTLSAQTSDMTGEEGPKQSKTAGANPWDALAEATVQGGAFAAQAASLDQAGLAEAAAQDGRDADERKFADVEAEVFQAIDSNPDLRPLAQNVIFERTETGLLIQIIDQDGKSMFASGSASVAGTTRDLMEKLGVAIAGLPNDVIITGHTDAVPFSADNGYGNWELSADRANATRRLLVASGVDAQRFTRISGLADTDPLIPNDPLAAPNRRITVHLIHRDSDASPEDLLPGMATKATEAL